MDVASKDPAAPGTTTVPRSPQLRKELREAFPTTTEIRTFLIDYFPGVIRDLSDDADPNKILNLLFQKEEPAKIWEELQNYLASVEPPSSELQSSASSKRPFLRIELLPDGSLHRKGLSICELMQCTWGSALTPQQRSVDLKCPWTYSRQESLARALLRLAIHGGVHTFAVRDPDFWFAKHLGDLNRCLGVDETDWQAAPGAISGMSRWCFAEAALSIPVEASTQADHVGGDGEQLADELHKAMDAWVLDRIDSEVIFFAESDELRFGVPYHPSYRSWIKDLWPHWRQKLASSPGLLRHVLSCTMTPPDAPKLQATAGLMRTGPKTVKRCLVPAFMFAMVIDAALASRQARVSPSQCDAPGNFELLQDGTQLVGLHLINRHLLSARLLKQMWGTPIVLLPHEQRSLRDLRNYRPIGSYANELDSMARKRVGEILITNDPIIMELLEKPPEQLGNYITQELQQLNERLMSEVAQAVAKSTGRIS